MLPIVFEPLLTISESYCVKELIVIDHTYIKNNAIICLRKFKLMAKHCVEDSSKKEMRQILILPGHFFCIFRKLERINQLLDIPVQNILKII